MDSIVNKTVLLFSRDPGGANNIIPLVATLHEHGYQVALYGKDIALDRYQSAGIEGIDINSFMPIIDVNNVKNFVKAILPIFVITGTSAEDMTEKYLWKACEQLGISCFAILDQWINYGVRFSRFGVSELDLYEKTRCHNYLPSFILVMDELAKKEAILDGLPEDKISITGSPYFETLIKRRESITEEKIINLKKGLGIKNQLVITFASEPISKDYKEIDGVPYFWGFNEKTILRELISSLSEQPVNHGFKGISIIIRLHPRQEDSELMDVVSSFKECKLNVVFDRRTDSSLLIAASDLVCGMSSMFLMEAFIIKKPVFSIQIGLCRQNPFVLDRIGLLKSITSRAELDCRLQGFTLCKEQDNPAYRIIPNASQHIISRMEQLLCLN